MKSARLLFVIALLCVSVLAQEKQPKVIKYEVPKYPPAAVATGTKGEVIVTVKIDNEGRVIQAKVESGHPLLRTISETTAKKWIFSPGNFNDEREVKLTFAYFYKFNNDKKNNNKSTKIKTRFKKPYRLEITATTYLSMNYTF